MHRFNAVYSTRRHSAPECGIHSSSTEALPDSSKDPLYYTVFKEYDYPPCSLSSRTPSSTDQTEATDHQSSEPASDAHFRDMISAERYDQAQDLRSSRMNGTLFENSTGEHDTSLTEVMTAIGECIRDRSSHSNSISLDSISRENSRELSRKELRYAPCHPPETRNKEVRYDLPPREAPKSRNISDDLLQKDIRYDSAPNGAPKSRNVYDLLHSLSTGIDSHIAAATQHIEFARNFTELQSDENTYVEVRSRGFCSRRPRFSSPFSRKPLRNLESANRRLKQQVHLLSADLQNSVGELKRASELLKHQLHAVSTLSAPSDNEICGRGLQIRTEIPDWKYSGSSRDFDNPEIPREERERGSERINVFSHSTTPSVANHGIKHDNHQASSNHGLPSRAGDNHQAGSNHDLPSKGNEIHKGSSRRGPAKSVIRKDRRFWRMDAVEFADRVRRRRRIQKAGILSRDSYRSEDVSAQREIQQISQRYPAGGYRKSRDASIHGSYPNNGLSGSRDNWAEKNPVKLMGYRRLEDRIPADIRRRRKDPRIFVTPSYATPVNAAYYTGGMYNPAYVPGYGDTTYVPYTQGVYFDPAVYSAYYGAYTGQTGAYRGYPQPQPSPLQYRRSRTAPARTLPRNTTYQTTSTATRRRRGSSIEPYYLDSRYYRSYSGPTKNAKNVPMYRKKREPNSRIQTYQETEFGGASIDAQSQYYPGAFSETMPTLRRMRPYYAPSYTTYPPSIMNASRNTRKNDGKQYPIALRIVMKAAELILGAAILGLILGPMRDYPFHVFVTMTKTEWQGLVIGIVSCFSVLALVMLATSCLAHKHIYWQRIVGL